MKEIEVLKLLPLEDRANMKKKQIPLGVILTLVLLGLAVGLFYWLVDDILFDYRTIYPFWGFVIFFIGGIFVSLVIIWIHSLYWSEYDKLIDDANKEIGELIKKGEGSPEELHRLKKEMIERKIGKETLTQEEFLWHSSQYCWGCGKSHTEPPKRYSVQKKRTESWKEGAFRYSKTFRKTGYIDICPECYTRLTNAEKQDKKNKPWIIVMTVTLGIGVAIGSKTLWGNDGFWISIMVVFLLGGWAILAGIAFLILYPFQKQGNTSTKWDFDEIPEIRKFMKQNLPHTH